jgi:hypothetical protein
MIQIFYQLIVSSIQSKILKILSFFLNVLLCKSNLNEKKSYKSIVYINYIILSQTNSICICNKKCNSKIWSFWKIFYLKNGSNASITKEILFKVTLIQRRRLNVLLWNDMNVRGINFAITHRNIYSSSLDLS